MKNVDRNLPGHVNLVNQSPRLYFSNSDIIGAWQAATGAQRAKPFYKAIVSKRLNVPTFLRLQRSFLGIAGWLAGVDQQIDQILY